MKFLNSRVENNIRILQWSFKVQALVGCATAECDIRLSMCECSIAQVDDDVVECFALTLMDGDCPCKFYRVLTERTYDHGLEAAMHTIVVVN